MSKKRKIPPEWERRARLEYKRLAEFRHNKQADEFKSAWNSNVKAMSGIKHVYLLIFIENMILSIRDM